MKLFIAVFAALLLAVAAKAYAGGNNFNDHNLNPTPILTVTTASSGASTLTTASATSAAVDIRLLNNVALQFDVGTASPGAVGGNYFVDVSEDYSPTNAGNWTTLSFGSQTASWSSTATIVTAGTPAAVFVSTTAGAVFYREVPNTPAAFLRVRYVATVTGAGVNTVYMSGK